MSIYYNIYLVWAYRFFLMIHNSETPYYYICFLMIYLSSLGLEGVFVIPRKTPLIDV